MSSRSRPTASATDPLLHLVQRVSRGDEGALALLYDSTSAHAYGMALQVLGERHAAEEAVVDVFAQVWRRAATYDASRGSVLAWITILARSRAIDVRRRRGRRSEREVEFDLERLELEGGSLPDPFEESRESERAGLVRKALARLPVEQRRAVETSFFGGLSHSEVARALGLPLGTIKSRIRAGLAGLRAALAGLEGELA